MPSSTEARAVDAALDPAPSTGGGAPEACKRCGAAGAGRFFESRDYLSGDSFAVLRCPECRVAWTDVGGNGFDAARYYPPSYYGAEGQRFRGHLEGLIGVFRQARVREILRQAPAPGRILDIGCGRGWMLSELHRRGWTCVGTEKTLDATLAADKPGFEILTRPSLASCRLASDSFQIITSWHSLEHLEDPWETLDEIARLLAPGGVVILEVPNLASLQARSSRASWFHLDCPRHLFHFSLEQLSSDLEVRGLEILAQSTWSLEYGPYGMWQSLLNLATRRPNVLFQLLRRQSPRTGAGDLLTTAVLLPLAILLGTPLELAAAAGRRGGVAHLVARKSP